MPRPPVSARSTADGGPATSRAIAVIDYSEEFRGGHFGPWLRWFADEFAQRFDTVLLFTPNPEGAAALFPAAGSAKPANVCCHPLPPGPRKRFWRLKRRRCPLATIFKRAGVLARNHTLAGFVMWGYDLLHPHVTAGRSGAPWATLGSVSFCSRGHEGAGAEKERALQALGQAHPDCKSVLLPDKYSIPGQGSKAQWIPGYENVKLPPECPVVARTIREFAGDRFCVGVFGQLSGPRCVDELLRLARCQPEMRFVLVGQLDENSVAEDVRPLLSPGRPGNVLSIRGFIKDELELNAAVEAADATLLDGKNQPSHSGIVTKALAYGRYVLTPASNSWIDDVIREYDVGLSYARHEMDFPGRWKAWLEAGGPVRARKAAELLMSPESIAECFDELTRRLSEGASPET